MPEPTHGVTKSGREVHATTHDHLPEHSAYARLNKRVALWLTRTVMTMSAFWFFCLLALCSLPAVLYELSSGLFGFFPAWLVKASLVALIAWVSSNFLQLVFLPALGVGQNLQSAASDARAEKTFEDTEKILDRLDIDTEGGIKSILDAVKELRQTLDLYVAATIDPKSGHIKGRGKT